MNNPYGSHLTCNACYVSLYNALYSHCWMKANEGSSRACTCLLAPPITERDSEANCTKLGKLQCSNVFWVKVGSCVVQWSKEVILEMVSDVRDREMVLKIFINKLKLLMLQRVNVWYLAYGFYYGSVTGKGIIIFHLSYLQGVNIVGELMRTSNLLLQYIYLEDIWGCRWSGMYVIPTTITWI